MSDQNRYVLNGTLLLLALNVTANTSGLMYLLYKDAIGDPIRSQESLIAPHTQPSQLTEPLSANFESYQKQINPTVGITLPSVGSDIPKQNEVIGLPNWDCSLYYCAEGDPKIYPLKRELASKLGSATSLTLKSNINPTQYAMAVVYDPTCPNCKDYFQKTLKPVLDNHGPIRIIPTVFDDVLSEYKLNEVRKLLCSVDLRQTMENLSLGLAVTTPYDCSIDLEQAKAIVETNKGILQPYGVAGVTPFTLTQNANWVGKQPYKTVKKYLGN